MNLIDMGLFKVLIDYGHNTEAINKTGEFIKSLMPGKKIRMASSIGNRRRTSYKCNPQHGPTWRPYSITS